jgi:hypothetical protein
MATRFERVALAARKEQQSALFPAEFNFQFTGAKGFQMVTLHNSTLKQYSELTLELKDGIYYISHRYGTIGSKCKLPVYGQFELRAMACAKLNSILERKQQLGFEIISVYEGSECIYRKQ